MGGWAEIASAIMKAGQAQVDAGMFTYQRLQVADQRREAYLNHARLANQAAADVVQRGSAEAARVHAKANAMEGEALAQVGASGLNASSYSVGKALVGSQEMAALDQLTLKANAARAAWGYRQEAASATKASEDELSNAKSEIWMKWIGASVFAFDPNSLQGVGGGGTTATTAESGKAMGATSGNFGSDMGGAGAGSSSGAVGSTSGNFGYDLGGAGRPRISR